jgi:cation transport ATPase
MASRERKRGERRKRKQRGADRQTQIAERREAMAARTEARNREAREELEPLAEDERPTVVTVGAIVSAIVALIFVVSTVLAIAGTEVNGETPNPVQLAAVAIVVGAMAWGMWRARYWAVLGFQASLALVMLAAALGLVRVTNPVQAIATTFILVGSGVLFYFMVKALARIQMPERRPPA